MGAEGIKVQASGALMDGTWPPPPDHRRQKPIAAGVAVPADDTHLHFGRGQIETTLKLAPGPHAGAPVICRRPASVLWA